MPEPMVLVQRRIRLYRTPAQVSSAVHDVPVFVSNCTALIAHPAQVCILEKSHIGEDEGVWLVGSQILDNSGKVISAPRASGPIQPELGEIPVPGRKLRQLA